jgi:tetratricopeptide (TPR) repeat protein
MGSRPIVAAVVAAVALAGCASVVEPPASGAPATDALLLPHRQRAETFARAGDLRRALDEWNIALTIDPGNAAAKAGRARVQGQIEAGVAARLRQGREALARGAQIEARRHFLAVLALDPANRTAFDALRTEVFDVRFIAHTVRAGDTLAALAERYYGDRSRSEVIFDSNQLRTTWLVAGTTLRIPEIPGVPFVHERRDPVTIPELPRGATPRDEVAPEVDPRLAEAREAFERGEYAVALADVEQVLAGNPRHAEGLDLRRAALYELAKSQLDERKFQESYESLTLLARVAPNYADSASLREQVRARLVQHRYNEGLRYYREEKLEEAIEQWKAVLALEPRHPSARKNIEQAEYILKQLEERRKR